MVFWDEESGFSLHVFVENWGYIGQRKILQGQRRGRLNVMGQFESQIVSEYVFLLKKGMQIFFEQLQQFNELIKQE